ncbi:hypothetical protein CN357_21120 [Bacillus cereus]|uniref:Uncharacterized protein n=2 Tax=Bacillus TaxID=1386 RepID=A0A9X6VVJ9_BACCE|nr:hypothetical protein [Bacillus cereus]PEZ75415.1 hypothetical protein CN410_15260 [Bacillus anthracis]PGB07070.1 hypothetical protein COM09_31595 [Bacillus toyonensis]KXY51264.1 hypothetical protein AT268_32785 [Bacillus cereus]PFF45962.1 hypothetical protein CN357_21120 [Bacillus cereus]PFQ36564.1 hypothetical protein COK33_17535 [Bacillus cereus]
MLFWMIWMVVWAIVLCLAIAYACTDNDYLLDGMEYFIMVLSVFAIVIGVVPYQSASLKSERELVIAGKLDLNKENINFKHYQTNVYVSTKDDDYKYEFKSGSISIIKWEKTDSKKEGRNKVNEPSLKNEEKVREMIANKLNLRKDEVVITKDKENVYTAITSLGKYVVETEENSISIKAMVKQG